MTFYKDDVIIFHKYKSCETRSTRVEILNYYSISTECHLFHHIYSCSHKLLQYLYIAHLFSQHLYLL